MSTEQTTTEQQSTETTTEAVEDQQSSNIRETPAFKAVLAQLKERDDKLRQIEEAQAQAKREAEEAKAKATGDFESFKAQLKAEKDAEIAKAKSELKAAKIDALVASIPDEWARKGVRADMLSLEDGADLSEYIEGLKKSAPNLFQAPGIPMSSQTPSGARVNNGSNDSDWASIKIAYNSRNPQKVADAISKVQAYSRANGKMPPGF